MATTTRRFSTGTLVRIALAMGTVLGIGTVATLAAWSDSSTAQATFSTGSIDIKIDGNDANPPTNPVYNWTNLSMSGMGDGSAKYTNLLVANAGTLPFTYTLGITNASGDAPLYAALRVSATVVPAGTTCDASGLAAGAGKTVLLTDATFAAAAFPAARTLTAGSSETICWRVQLPTNSSNTLQGKSTVANFLFTATQSTVP